MTPPSRLRSRAGQEAKRLAEDVGLTDNHSAAFRAGFMSAVDWMQSQPSPAATGERERVADLLAEWDEHGEAVAFVAIRNYAGSANAKHIADYATDWFRRWLATLGRDAPETLDRRPVRCESCGVTQPAYFGKLCGECAEDLLVGREPRRPASGDTEGAT